MNNLTEYLKLKRDNLPHLINLKEELKFYQVKNESN